MESACKAWLSFTRSPGSFVLLLGPAALPLGKASWDSAGQSHGKLFAHIKRLLKSQVIKASFTSKSVPSKDGLAYVTEHVTTYKTQHLQLVSEVPTKHPQTTDQHDLLFCTDPPCRKPVFHLMFASISSLELTLFFSFLWCFEIFGFDVRKTLLSINVKSRLKKIKQQK